LPIKKVKEGLSRMFQACSPIGQVESRQTFAHMMATFKAHNTQIFKAVGLSPKGMSWGALMRRLTKYLKFICGDIGNNDNTSSRSTAYATLMANMAWFEYRCTIMDEETGDERPLTKEELRIIYLKMSASMENSRSAVMIYRNIVYRSLGRTASGHLRTSDTNSDDNGFELFTSTWMSLVESGDNPLENPEDILDHMELAVQGDDHVGSLSEVIAAHTNQIKIGKCMTKYFNRPYTAPNKDTDLPEWFKWEDVVFLQRKFVERDGFVWAPLKEESIYNMMHWVSDASRRTEITCDLALSAAEEWAMYPRERFDLEVKKILQSFTMSGIKPPVIPSYEELTMRVLTNV
jgi:hypothetical protein